MRLRKLQPKQRAAANRVEIDLNLVTAFFGALFGTVIGLLLPPQTFLIAILLGTFMGMLGTKVANWLYRRNSRRTVKKEMRFDDFVFEDAPSGFATLKNKSFRTTSLSPMFATYKLIKEGSDYRLIVSDLYDEGANPPYPSSHTGNVTLYDSTNAGVGYEAEFSGGKLTSISPKSNKELPITRA